MCYGKCARCIGHSLVGLAVLSIVANILLYFPNGETRFASEDLLSRFVWFFSGIVGGGLLILLPAFVFIGLEEEDCCGCCGHENCGKSCAMLSSVMAALIGLAGSGYCVIVAALGLAEGPKCLDRHGAWNYTFAHTNGEYVVFNAPGNTLSSTLGKEPEGTLQVFSNPLIVQIKKPRYSKIK